MKVLKSFVAAFVFLSIAHSQALAGQREDVMAMAETAAGLLRTEAPEDAFEEMKDKFSSSEDNNVYVFVFDKNGVAKFHGMYPMLVGKNLSTMKDITGYPFMHVMLQVKDRAWVDYKWPDASDMDRVKDKSTYVIRVGDYLVTVGYYKQQK